MLLASGHALVAGCLTIVGGPQAIGGGRWKEPSNPITTTMSTPSGTKSRISMPTTTRRRSESHSTVPRSSASSAASPGGAGGRPVRGKASSQGPQHLSPRGSVDLQRVRCPDGADTRRGAPKPSPAPKVARMDTRRPHATVGSAGATAGPHPGHERPDRSGQHRSPEVWHPPQLTGQNWPSAAGRHHRPALPRTEEATGFKPLPQPPKAAIEALPLLPWV